MKVEPLLAGAAGGHGAAVGLHQCLDDRQAETQARVHLRRRAVTLAERFEDRWQEVRSDTLAVVSNQQLDAVPTGRSVIQIRPPSDVN